MEHHYFMSFSNFSLNKAPGRLKAKSPRYQMILGLGALLLFLSALLAAQQGEKLAPPMKSTPAVSETSGCPPDKARALLPVLPRPIEEEGVPLTRGATAQLKSDPNESKA